MSLQEVVRPDAVFSGDYEEEVTGPLDPCPACGSRPHEAPEGTHDSVSLRKHPHNAGSSEDGSSADPLNVGDARWNFQHCWRCGYRPGTNQVMSQNELRRQFAQFKKMMDDHQASLNKEKGMLPPGNSEEMDALRAELEAARSREAELRSRLEGNDGPSS